MARLGTKATLGVARRLLQVPGGKRPIVYLLRDEFTTARSAGSVNGTAAEPGPGTRTVVDTNNRVSIADERAVSSSHSDNSTSNAIIVYEGRSRVAGRTLTIRHRNGSVANVIYVAGWSSGATSITGGQTIRTSWQGGSTIDVAPNGVVCAVEVEADSTDYIYQIILFTVGALYLVKGGAFTDWTPLFLDTFENVSTLYPMLNFYKGFLASSDEGYDALRVTDMGAPLDDIATIATLNVASPSVQDYTATADQLLLMTVTAPGSLTTEAGIIYRKVDANNHWRAYFNTSGAFNIDSVSGGTPTNRISVAGVISAGATRTIELNIRSNKHDAYTYATSWAKRGGQVGNTLHQERVTVAPDIGAGWTAANLISIPFSGYSALDNI